MNSLQTDGERQLSWDRVNNAVQRCSERLVSACIAEDFASIAHTCREGLISLSQAIWDPDRHPVTDVENVSGNDAKRMLNAYFAIEFSGSNTSSESIRKIAKASVDLANAVQQRRTASFNDASLALESFVYLVNIAAISEKRCNASRPWEIIRNSPTLDEFEYAAIASRDNFTLTAYTPGVIWDTILMPGAKLAIQIFPAFSLNKSASVPIEIIDRLHANFVPNGSISFDGRPSPDGHLMWAMPTPGPDLTAPHRFSTWCSQITSRAILFVVLSIQDMETATDAIDGYALEKYLATNILRFCAGYNNLGVTGPAFISVSLTDVLNKTLCRSRPSAAKGFNRPFILLPDLYLSDIAAVVDKDLQPIKDKLWRAAGWPA
jgi:hypothetical protein